MPAFRQTLWAESAVLAAFDRRRTRIAQARRAPALAGEDPSSRLFHVKRDQSRRVRPGDVSRGTVLPAAGAMTMPAFRETLQAEPSVLAALEPRRGCSAQAGGSRTPRAPLPWRAKTCRPFPPLAKRQKNPQGRFAQLFHVEQSPRPEAP
jgi:hypothetical protein